jgi:hypothetical protein
VPAQDEPRSLLRSPFRPWREKRTLARVMDSRGGKVGERCQLVVVGQPKA